MPYAEHIPEDWKTAAPAPEAPIEPEADSGETPAMHAVLVFLLGTILGSAILLPGIARGIAFGRWQGVLADVSELLPAPLLSAWAAEQLRNTFPETVLLALNLHTVVTAALAIGALAGLTYTLARHLLAPAYSLLTALSSGALFAATPVFHYEATAASPLPLTLFLALTALLLLVQQLQRPRGLLLGAAAGAMAGLAAANHPTFGLLLPLFLIATIVISAADAPLHGRIAGITVGFAITAILPLQVAMRRGETIREFLAHALYTPYPAPGIWPPPLGDSEALLDLLPVQVWLPALAGLFFLLRAPSRIYGIFAFALMLSMGPLVQSITNSNLSPMTPYATDAPQQFALAFGCIFIAVGAGCVLFRLLQATPLPRLRPALAGALLFAYFAFFWPTLPLRNHDWADRLGRELIAGRDPNTVMITGNPLITSLVLAARAVTPEQAGLTVIPASALYDLEGIGNRRLAQRGLLPPSGLVDPTASRRWKHELKRHTQGLGEETGRATALGPMLLWDFVTLDFRQQTTDFAGVSAPWLTARATRDGLLLRYPLRDGRGVNTNAPLTAPDSVPNDPDGARTAAALLLPLSDQARQQGSAGVAHRLAIMAQTMVPDNPEAERAAVRAQARLGEREAALAAAADSRTQESVSVPFNTQIESELARHAAEMEMRTYLAGIDDADPDWERRVQLLGPLWDAEEFVLLRVAYEALQERFSLDLDAGYQLAAVHAQFGHWDRVDRHLQRWQRIGGFGDHEVEDILLADGRFGHYVRYRSARAAPPPQT